MIKADTQRSKVFEDPFDVNHVLRPRGLIPVKQDRNGIDRPQPLVAPKFRSDQTTRGYYITKIPINPIRKTETPMIATTMPTPWPSVNPPGSSLSDSTFSWTPGYNQTGNYSVPLTVLDSQGGSDSETVTFS